jgi:CheY-like chemotaxis protein
MMKKILVIEDEIENREMFLESLEAEGFNAIGAENGRQGIQVAREQLPDLIVCDFLMPELDGCEVLRRLRQNPLTAAIPFIFLTAKRERVCAREAKADGYLTKPCTVENLLGAIAQVFKIKQP